MFKILFLIYLQISIISCLNQNLKDGFTLHFPKYTIKLFNIPENTDEIGQYTQEIPMVHHYLNEPKYEQTISEYPLIHREPIEIKPLCTKTLKYEPKSSSHINWYYSPSWKRAESTILREATPTFPETDNHLNPRSSFHSSSHFVKIQKPFGSKLIISKQKTFGNHPFGSFDNFHHIPSTHYSHVPFSHNIQNVPFSHNMQNVPFSHNVQNVNKNTNIHVHNRNAEMNDRFLGSHLFGAPRWPRSVVSRKKRGVVDAMRLVTDHRTKIDIPKTAENIGSATRNVFEEDFSPVYHMRNALSSANNVVYSLMNVRPNGILIPCRYKIVDGNQINSANPILGAINPELYQRNGITPPEGSSSPSPDFENDNSYRQSDPMVSYEGDPMQKLGRIIQNSVMWAHKSAEHAADAMHSARKAVVTARRHWPKLFLPYVSAVEIEKPQIGTRKLGNEEIVGSPQDPEFVGVGKMLDYLGMTHIKPDISPRVGQPMTEEELILQKAKASLGAPTYRQFLYTMKNELAKLDKAKDMVATPRFSPETLKAKLAIERLKAQMRLRKAKADLNIKRLSQPKLLKPPKLPLRPILPKSPLLRQQALEKKTLPTLPKPATLAKKQPTLLEKIAAKKTTPKPEIIDPKVKLAKAIEDVKEKLKQKLNITKEEPPKTKAEETKEKIAKSLKDFQQKINLRMSVPKKDEDNSSEDILKSKLFEKYNIPEDDENISIFSKALEKIKNSDLVGEPLVNSNEIVQSVPGVIYTKEMLNPFMGLATKEELDKYFQEMYGETNNDKIKT